MSVTRRFGWRPSPPDPRDYKFADVLPRFSLAATTGDEYRIPLHRLPKNQVGGSCTANSWAMVNETLSDLVGQPEPDLSAHGLYWCERQQIGETDQDGGAYNRVGADCLRIFGIGPESSWPQSDATLFTQPDAGYFVAAADHKAAAYYSIASLDEAEVAIRANHPVVFGCQVGQDFVDYDGLDASRVFDAPAASLGGHAMHWVAVRGSGAGRQWLARTSWGAFGIDGMGLAWMSEAYAQAAEDLWVLTRSA